MVGGQAEEEAAAAVVKDKFGKGRSKVRSRKEERREGRDWDRPPVKEGRRKGGKKVGGREDEVEDFELTIGPDGQFKIL